MSEFHLATRRTWRLSLRYSTSSSHSSGQLSSINPGPLAIYALAACLIFAAGCKPPAAPIASQHSMAVGIPIGSSSDSGVLNEAEIAPPNLVGIDRTAAKSVSMRITEAVELVQTSAPSPPPTPEFVPPPPPEPIEVTPAAAPSAAKAAPQAKPAIAKDTPELIPTPKGEPDPKAVEPMKLDSASESEPKMTAPAVTPEVSADVKDPAKSSDLSATAVKPMSVPPGAGKSTEPNLPTDLEGPEDYTTWETPAVALIFTGQQHGYLEPCGCTGLDRQKGGVARRFTFIDSLNERGWNVVPMDAGNQVRRFGRQAAIKLQQTVRALREMKYQAVGFGPDDVRLGVGDLLAVAAEESMFVSANVVLFDPEYMPTTKLIEQNGMKIGVTSVLDPKSLAVPPDDALLVNDPVQSATDAAAELAAKSPDFSVLLFFGKDDAAKELVRKVEGFDLIVVAGGYGEPTYQAESIEGSNTKIIVTGDKGMYAGVVGLYRDEPMKYARVPLTHEYTDAPEMRAVMKDYQNQLRDIGLGQLGLLPPIKHSSSQTFVGSEACGKCHTNAYAVWENSAHAEATEHLVHPPKERSDISRHFDPECISCHVTGWNPQEYYPYETGYLSLEDTPHLTGNGCENCHGPGAAHTAAEAKGSTVGISLRDELRESMKLPLAKAREKCMTCHDLDNSPDFHEPDAFEDVYWPEVEHYGLD